MAGSTFVCGFYRLDDDIVYLAWSILLEGTYSVSSCSAVNARFAPSSAFADTEPGVDAQRPGFQQKTE